jgi:hypothetical protein
MFELKSYLEQKMKFANFLQKDKNYEIEHDGDGDYTLIHINGEYKGQVHTSEGHMIEEKNVKMLIGDKYQGEPVRRTNGIIVKEPYKGQGYGKIIWLSHMMQFPNTWFYNSQTWPDATNLFKALASKGLMELHWRREPRFGGEGGPHVCRITSQGIAFVNSN